MPDTSNPTIVTVALALVRAGLLYLLIFNLCRWSSGAAMLASKEEAARWNKLFNLVGSFGALFALSMGWLS